MSRIRRGLHTVTVYPRTHTVDAYGGDVMETLGTGVPVQCNVQPSSANEVLDLPGGLTPTTVYRIKYWPQEHGAPWPGTSDSLIEIDGQTFEQRGEPQISRMSSTTGHVKVFAVAYTPGRGGDGANVMGRI